MSSDGQSEEDLGVVTGAGDAGSESGMIDLGDLQHLPDGEEGSLDGLLEGEDDDINKTCSLCNGDYKCPRVLNCLHIFCNDCLETKMPDQSTNGFMLTCPVCEQETPLNGMGLKGLPEDYVMSNLLDIDAVTQQKVQCQSCTSNLHMAVARCVDCAAFLCANCDQAHRFMNLFKNHKVVKFESMVSGEETIHKPIHCVHHPAECLKVYCQTCQTAICNDCLMAVHRQHQVCKLDEVDTVIEELKQVVETAENTVKDADENQDMMEKLLHDLQEERDQSRGQIEETFQSWKALLGKARDAKFEELEVLNNRRRNDIMEEFTAVQKTVDKFGHAVKFARRVLEKGNKVEVLSLKKPVLHQLHLLKMHNTSLDVAHHKILFSANPEAIKGVIDTHFGSFKDSTPLDSKASSPNSLQSSAFDTEGALSLQASMGVFTTDSLIGQTSLASAFAAVANGTSMSGSGQGGLESNSRDFGPGATNLFTLGDALGLPTLLSHLPDIQGSMASTAMTDTVTNSTAAGLGAWKGADDRITGVDSGVGLDGHHVPVGTAITGARMEPIGKPAALSEPAPTITMEILQKLGRVGVTRNGEVTLNGHSLPGLTANHVVGLPPTLLSRSQSLVSGSSPQGLSGLSPTPDQLGGAETPNSTGSGTTGTFDALSSLMNSLPSGNATLGSLLANPPTTPTSFGGSLPSGLPNTMPGVPITGMHSAMGTQRADQQYTPTAPGGQHPPFPSRGKLQPMSIRSKFGNLGPGKTQFNSPHGFCLGLEEDIVVADTNNHRIGVFEKTGELKYSFGIPGRDEGQLWYPRKVAVLRSSSRYVVCDRGNERSRMQIFSKTGHFVKKIAIRYIDIVAGLAVTVDGKIVAVDSVSPTVFVISESGDLLKWFDCSEYMREPSDIAVNAREFYVCDFKGHCVVVFNEDGQFVRRIGAENITNFPNGIDISDAGDVLVGDSHGNRFHVSVFQRDGSIIGEFDCPYVKVSRCCGLKITSEGYIVTLAKNNHHVLVLNTLYIA